MKVEARQIRAGIVVINPVAQTSYVSLAASAGSVVIPAASISHIFIAAVADSSPGIYADTSYQLINAAVSALNPKGYEYYVDAIVTTDNKVISLSKQVTDSISIQESLARSIFKVVQDSVVVVDQLTALLTAIESFSEQFDLTEAVALSVTRPLSDTVSVSDLFSKQFAKQSFDTISVSDFGSGVSQGYVDLSYFAQDYVGQSFTF